MAVEHGDLGGALTKLSPELRAVVQVTVLDGLTTREAARLLDIPAGTVSTEGVPLDRLVVEGAGILLLAMALSTAFGGDRGAFLFAVGLLGAVVVQARWPAWSLFPMAPGTPGWSRAALAWGVVAAVSAGALFVLSRDPCLRRRSAGSATRSGAELRLPPRR